MSIGASSCTTLALVIHELSTNSAKYGALSASSGTLDVQCHTREDEVTVIWTERGGPAVAPKRKGFGTQLMQRSMVAQLGGTIVYDWGPEGVVVTLRMSQQRLES
jgi:two-component sensor histidine kinase